MRTRGRIKRTKAGPRALFVELAVPPTARTGSGMTPPSERVGRPWAADVPDPLVAPLGLGHSEGPGEVVVDGPGLPEGDEPDRDSPEELPWDGVGRNAVSWYPNPSCAGAAAPGHHRWGLGWNQGWPRPAPDRRLPPAAAQTPDGAEVRRCELGAGRVRSALPPGDRLAVSVALGGGAGEVLALDADTNGVTVLLAADTIDITELGWPVVPRPVDADSCGVRVRVERTELNLAWDGVFDLLAAPVGEGPDTPLEWTLRLTQRPVPRRHPPRGDRRWRRVPARAGRHRRDAGPVSALHHRAETHRA